MTYVLILLISVGCGPLGCGDNTRYVEQIQGFQSIELCEKAGVEYKRKIDGSTRFDVYWSCLQKSAAPAKAKR